MDIKKLQDIVGIDYVITDRAHMQSYLCDETVLTVRPKPADNVVGRKTREQSGDFKYS